MFTVSVSSDALKALALIAPKADVRTCLNSVCVDLTTPGRVHLVTTDGHRMLIVGNATIEGERIDGQYLIPIDAIRAVKPLSKSLNVAIEIEGGEYTLRGKIDMRGRLLDERFAQWQRVIPDARILGDGNKIGHFNMNYVGDFGRVATLLGCADPAIVHNGEKNASVVLLGATAFGVLMPFYLGKPEARPVFVDWLEAPKPEGLKAAA